MKKSPTKPQTGVKPFSDNLNKYLYLIELFIIIPCFMLHWRRHCLCPQHFAMVELDPANHNGDWSQLQQKGKTNKQSEGACSCIIQSVSGSFTQSSPIARVMPDNGEHK